MGRVVAARRLTDAEVEEIQRLCALRKTLTNKALAYRFGVTTAMIDTVGKPGFRYVRQRRSR